MRHGRTGTDADQQVIFWSRLGACSESADNAHVPDVPPDALLLVSMRPIRVGRGTEADTDEWMVRSQQVLLAPTPEHAADSRGQVPLIAPYRDTASRPNTPPEEYDSQQMFHDSYATDGGC